MLINNTKRLIPRLQIDIIEKETGSQKRSIIFVIHYITLFLPSHAATSFCSFPSPREQDDDASDLCLQLLPSPHHTVVLSISAPASSPPRLLLASSWYQALTRCGKCNSSFLPFDFAPSVNLLTWRSLFQNWF